MEIALSSLSGLPAHSIGLSQAQPASSPRGGAKSHKKCARSATAAEKSPPAAFLDREGILGGVQWHSLWRGDLKSPWS